VVDENNPVVLLRKDDWEDICWVMRTLVWGKRDCSCLWFKVANRVRERNGFPVSERSNSDAGRDQKEDA